ncbi:MAG: cadmium-translocating P-type ATPase [Anaerolineae bacterium]|nr:cadmium-translocating P-type ATPase [Anaerolineae bacterium]
MAAVAAPTPKPTQNQSSESPRWLTEAWLAPRLVAVTLVALVAGVILSSSSAAAGWVTLCAVVAYAAGGFYGTRGALTALIRERVVDIDALMVLAALGAAVIGHWEEGALLLFLFSLSNVLQDYAIGRSRTAIKALFKLYPEQATVQRDGGTEVVPVSALKIGDVVQIVPGERIPVDGVVLVGASSVNQAPITGESVPVDKTIGDTVFAGTLNEQGALDVRVTKLAAESTLSRIITLVEQAQSNQAPTQRFLEAFERRYAVFVIGFIALFIVAQPLFGWADLETGFYRAMVLMTVASPCALVISVPSSFIAAIAAAARRGVLFKGGAALEELAAVRVIAFDKTGTLTTGHPAVTDVVALGGGDESAVLTVAASAESRSEHPLARAVVRAAEKRGLALQSVEGFESQMGLGITATVGGRMVRVGRPTSLGVELPAELNAAAERLHAEGKTVIGVVADGAWLGVLALADTLRPESADVIRGLRAKGVEVVLLTGDNPAVAAQIAAQVGISEVRAGLMPDDKAEAITALRERYGSVAMVGDGVNDAPALAAANVGIAMGAAGSDVALETADVVLMGDRLAEIAGAIGLSQRARRVVWQNIVFSLAVIVVLVVGTFAINLPLPVGVFGHEGSTVVVVLNGLIQLLVLEGHRRPA